MLAACLTCMSQPQLNYTELFWVVAFYSYQRLGCRTILALLPCYYHWPETDVTFRQFTVLWRVRFQKVQSMAQYMRTCTAHTVVKSRAVQQHPGKSVCVCVIQLNRVACSVHICCLAVQWQMLHCFMNKTWRPGLHALTWLWTVEDPRQPITRLASTKHNITNIVCEKLKKWPQCLPHKPKNNNREK